MAITTNINLNAGGVDDEIVVRDQNGNAIPPQFITWSAPTDPNVTVAPDSDTQGFDFIAADAAAAGSVTAVATYNGPGNPSPVVGPVLTINVTAAPPSVTALQYDEVKGG